MRWDERVRCYRAPARFRASIRQHLETVAVRCEDAVMIGGPRLERRPPPDLRPYQVAALAAWDLAGHSGVVVLPTGSGKTRVAIAAMARQRCSAICLVPTRVLLHQWRSVLAEHLGIETGCFGDGVRELRAITVATYESAYRHMQELGNRFDLLIVDEAHHFGHGLRDEALEMCAAAQRLGLTATPPSGSAALGLERLLGPVVYEQGIQDLVGTFLAEFEIIELRVKLTVDEETAYRADRDQFRAAFDAFLGLAPGAPWEAFVRWAGRSVEGRGALQCWRRSRNLLALTRNKNELVGRLLDRHRDARTLVFTADKEAAYGVARSHLIMPITSDIGQRERDAVIEAFRNGELRALVSARVLNEGFDVPDADVGIIVSGALGVREHVQRVGRLLRPLHGKRALVYELVTHATTEIAQAQRRRRGLGSTSPL